MNTRPAIRRAIRAIRLGRPVPKDVAEVLAPALEAAIDKPAIPFEQSAGLIRTDAIREAQAAALVRAAALLLPSQINNSSVIRKFKRAAPGIESLIFERDAHDLLGKSWQRELLTALRLGDLPGDRTLHKVCNLARNAKTPV